MAAQTFLFYFRMFPEDPMRIKVMVRDAGHRQLVDDSPLKKGFRRVVGAVSFLPSQNSVIKVVSPGIRRLLDFIHACLMCSATWNYLILNFGDPAILDHIPG